MRGTQRVGSLVRLLLCAGFLCVAWVVLSSSQAHAAERADPIDQLLTVVTDVTPLRQADPSSAPTKTGSEDAGATAAKDTSSSSGETEAAKSDPAKTVVTKARPTGQKASETKPSSQAPDARNPLQSKGVRDLVDTVVDVPEATLAPLVDQVQTATASTVTAGTEVLKGTAAAVPALEQPLAELADGLVALVEVLPVVGVDPVVESPLPLLPGGDTLPAVELEDGVETPIDRAANSVAALRGTLSTRTPADPLGGHWNGWVAGALLEAPPVTDAAVTASVRSGLPDPTDLPGPSPSPLSAPMPVGSSVPAPGPGSAPGDVACFDPASLLPRPTTGAFSSCDWRAPGGQPADPGSRPD